MKTDVTRWFEWMLEGRARQPTHSFFIDRAPLKIDFLSYELNENLQLNTNTSFMNNPMIDTLYYIEVEYHLGIDK